MFSDILTKFFHSSFIFSYKIIIIFDSQKKNWIKKNFTASLISKWICVTKFPIIGLLIESRGRILLKVVLKRHLGGTVNLSI